MLRKVLRKLHVLRFFSNDLPVSDNNSKTVDFLANYYCTYYTTVYWCRTFKEKDLYFCFECINDTL